MANTYAVPPTPTREQIEAFRREHIISAHQGETAEAGLEPWAIEHNMVLRYLCSLALEREAFPPEVARRQVPPELYDGMAVYVELGVEKTETIRPQMVADVLDALMRLIRKRWKAEAAESPLRQKP